MIEQEMQSIEMQQSGQVLVLGGKDKASCTRRLFDNHVRNHLDADTRGLLLPSYTRETLL